MLTVISNDELDDLESTYPVLKDYEKMYILYQNERFSYLPRYFFQQFPYTGYKFFNDPNFSEQSVDVVYEGQLREYQHEGVDLIIDTHTKTGQINGIFEARPAYGKTSISTYLTSTLKKKTLIVLDNSKLMQQWINAYVKFTNLTEEDIGIIKGSKLELDKPVCIAMVQTLMSKVKRDLKTFYGKFRDAGFGLVIYDEVHKTSAGPRFATSTLLLPTKNIIGLSATPFAHDVNSVLLFNSIGNVFYVYKDYEVPPKHVYFIKYDSGLGAKYKKKLMFLDYIKGISFYNSIIFDNKPYLELLCGLAKKCVANGHYTLIIVSTIKQVENVIEKLQNLGLSPVPVYSKSNKIIPGQDKLLVGTMKFASTGFDYDQLSALILGSPIKGKTSIIQSVGRVIRSHPEKPPPVVIDLMDQSFPNLFEKNIKIKVNIIANEFKVPADAFKVIQYTPKEHNDDDY